MSLSKKTPQELNEGVAKMLGLKILPSGCPPTGCWVNEYKTSNNFQYEHEFNPATDPAAALWALTRFCDEKGWGYLIEREPGSKQISIEFSRGDQGFFFGRQDGFALPELICRAIVGAAE